MFVQPHGYTGDDWYKQPLVFGYSDRVAERVSNLNPSAEWTSLLSTAVASGYLHIIQALACYDANSTVGTVKLIVSNGTVHITLKEILPAAVGTTLTWNGAIVLKEGDYAYAQFGIPTAGDDLYLDVWGYKMKINM